MSAVQLSHFSIRTPDLEASRKFYCDILELRVGARPPFAFPGLWLYDASDHAVVHLIGTRSASEALSSYLGARADTAEAGGALDHVAFAASDWPLLKARCDAHQIAYQERIVPELEQHQVFLADPCGVVVELVFDRR